MKMLERQTNEAGPVAVKAGFAIVTKPNGIATLGKYNQPGRLSKRNTLAVYTPSGRIAISARQERRTITALIAAGNKGVTAFELSSWAYRLAAYIHILRDGYGLTIETIRNPMTAAGMGAMFCTHLARLSALAVQRDRTNFAFIAATR